MEVVAPLEMKKKSNVVNNFGLACLERKENKIIIKNKQPWDGC